MTDEMIDAAGGTEAPGAIESVELDTLGNLAQLADLPLADHPDLYQRIHVELQDALAAIDDA